MESIVWSGSNAAEICDALSSHHRGLVVSQDGHGHLFVSFNSGQRRETLTYRVGDRVLVPGKTSVVDKIIEMVDCAWKQGVELDVVQLSRTEWMDLMSEIRLSDMPGRLPDFSSGEFRFCGVHVTCPEILEARKLQVETVTWRGDNLQEVVDTVRQGFMVDTIEFKGSGLYLWCRRHPWDHGFPEAKKFAVDEGDEIKVEVRRDAA